LRPITERIPKGLVEVAGRPFLAWQIELLREAGVTDLVMCVGYLGEMIEAEFGDGSAMGVRIRYSFDGEKLLGTGGAVRRAVGMLPEEFFVMYGDSYLPIDYGAVGRAFEESGMPALMTVFENEGKWDTSNVWFEDGVIRNYDKFERTPEMRHIDYGLSAWRREEFERIEAGAVVDLAEVFRRLVGAGRLAGYEVSERFYEVGSHAGLAELDERLRRVS
jgi:NDP-sugar pyrophosphorylase family protein